MSVRSGNTTTHFRSEVFKYGAPLSLELGRVIFKQGELSTSFFYIVEGQVELQFDGSTRRILKEGDFFGELRCLGDLPRTATATCLTSCQLVEIPGDKLQWMVSQVPSVRKKILPKYGFRLLHSKLRDKMENHLLSDAECFKIFSKFKRYILPQQKFLVHEGGGSDMVYFILSGCLIVSEGNKIVASLGAGNFVGELGVIFNIPRTASVYAVSDTEVLGCSAEQMHELLKEFPALNACLRTIAIRRLKQLEKFHTIQLPSVL